MSTFSFDQWMQENHSDILEKFGRRTGSQKKMSLWEWLLEYHSQLITDGWKRVAKYYSHKVMAQDE